MGLTWAGVDSRGRDMATWGDEWPWGVVGVSLRVRVGESVSEGRGVTMHMVGLGKSGMAMRGCRPWAGRGHEAPVVVCRASGDVVGVWRGISGGLRCLMG